MIELYNIGVSEEEISNMIDLYKEIETLEDHDVLNKIKILKDINCSDKEILNIIISNPEYLILLDEDVLTTLNKLKDLGYNDLNILIDSDPYILSLEEYEIKNYLEEENYEEN